MPPQVSIHFNHSHKTMASRENDDKQPGFSVQEWDDGSRYEGEFMNGLKHGNGKYTWKTGEVPAFQSY